MSSLPVRLLDFLSAQFTKADLYVVFPNIENLPLYLDNTERLSREFLVPAAALRLQASKDFETELLYSDSGEVISFMTALAVDPYNGVAFPSGVLQYGGFAVCHLDEETRKTLQ